MKTTLKTTGNKSQDLRLHFWRENKIDKHFILTEEEFIRYFEEWLTKQQKEWLQYYGCNISTIVLSFVTFKDGLNSTPSTDDNQYKRMDEILKPIRNNYFIKHNLFE